MTNRLSLLVRWRHRLIRSRWQRWWFPVLCCFPYLLSIVWLLQLNQQWIVGVLLAPLGMAAVIAFITWVLARQEFR